MLPTATSRATLGARRLPSQHVSRSSAALASGVSSSPAQHSRCFCLGAREARGRRRSLRYRHMESVHRQLSWENQPRTDDTKPIIKKHITLSTAPFAKFGSGDVNANVDEIKSWSDDLSGIRPGRNIEDVEREAINHLFGSYQHEIWRAPLNSIRNLLKSHHTPKENVSDNVTHGDSHIDPITNRRVSNTKSFDSQTVASTTKYDDAGKYGPSKWNEPDGLQKPTAEEQSKRYKDLGQYKPILGSSDNFKPPVAEDKIQWYSDLGKYNPVQWNEPHGLQQSAPEEQSKNYNDLNKYAPELDSSIAPRGVTEEPSQQYADLKNYKPASWNEPDGQQTLTPEEQSKVYNDLGSYGAVSWNEPDGLPDAAPEEKSKQYDDLGTYKATQWNEPDGLRKPTPEELSKNYDDLSKYNAVQWREPNGLPNPTEEERSKNYADLGEYKPVQWNEPDGLPSLTPEEASKSYGDVDKYGPVAWSEPDGLRPLNPEEKSKNYDDLQKYSAPFVAKASVLEEFERAQLDTTLKGNLLPSKVEVKSEDPAKEYTDLAAYGPARWNEPDGLPKPTPEELSKNYNDLHMYRPAQWNEPDGLPSRTPEEKSKDYKDVHAYSANSEGELEDVPQRIHPEEASKNYNDVGLYGAVRWNEPDGLGNPTAEEKSKAYSDLPSYAARDAPAEDVVVRRHPEEASKNYKDLDGYSEQMDSSATPQVHPEEASKAYQDLAKYQPQKFDSPDENRPIHPEEASKEYKDLGKYSASFEEAETLERTHPEQLTKQYKDLDKYAPKSFDPANKTYPVHSEEATKAYKDLHLYGTVSHNEPDGLPGKHQDPTSQGLGPYDSKVRAEQEKTLTMGRHWGQANRMSSSTLEDSMDSLDNLTAQDIRADVLRKVQETRQNETLDSAKAEHESSWDATTNQARDQIHDAKTKNTHRLTGNYTQDFSEDFARSWSTENSSTGAALFPKDLSGGDGNHSSSAKSSSVEPEDEPDLESMDGCFPTETFRPEPALNRQLSKKGRNKLDNSATNATVAGTGAGHLATSETGQMPDSEAESFATSQQSENPSTASVKPEKTAAVKNEMASSFKLLAYDSSSDKVHMADATSELPQSTSPQTATDLILNLNNAAKFFPHISSLQSRGYELVSGNKDVLVLQKVREASTSVEGESPAGTTAHHRVNPIDMMGRSVTGNFASPTGFVNYDTVFEPVSKNPTSTHQAEPNTYQEEAETRKQEDRGNRKKRGIGRRAIVGVVWIAGVSYAVGAVAESLTRRAPLSERTPPSATGPVTSTRAG
ncbi:unnamed protein product [Clonostachys rosea f. rosea IK726]|uniref:Uncharacterized protein n=1 Tax=Clonostachys rosea f. rosea IK726 TaxID=1349383 RepID=A0ACA9TFQ1_BIOOC|nr:unnamed protein product [Clonostachys rosea f. rosea IK726]